MLVLLVLMVLLVANDVFAGSWSIHCTNYSCVAKQGSLKVYWVNPSKLTGIEGIPIKSEDYQVIKKEVENAIKEAVNYEKKQALKEIKMFFGIEAIEKKANLLEEENKIGSEKMKIDYTLALVEWVGDIMFDSERGVKKYLASADFILDTYKKGNIEALVRHFFIARKAELVNDIPLLTKLNEKNKDLIITKYISLTQYPHVVDIKQRYAFASGFVYNLALKPHMAVKLSEEFKLNLNALDVILKPYQTASSLYETDKDLAFSKWLADNNKLTDNINKMPIEDKYIVAIQTVQQLNNKQLRQDTELFSKLREDFETALKNKDESVTIVTNKGIFGFLLFIVAIVVLLGIFLELLARWIISKQETNMSLA